MGRKGDLFSMTSKPRPRRDFLSALVLGGPAASLAARAAAADDKPGEDKPAPAEPKVKASAEADARMELVLARFGKSLDDDARASVRAEVEAIVHRAELLRKFPLDNGDGPFPVFIPYRAPLEPFQ
jgi:hypothetical protein